jgi:peptidoglycan/LPS O-acetylase OafA/YrhL
LSTLANTFDARRNSFDALRLVLAGLVAIDHGVILHTGVVSQANGTSLGDFAVDGFFVLSGFLVCRSYLRLNSLPRFVWHRFLRIMPGFWACLLVTALVVAPLVAILEGRPFTAAFTGEPSAVRYVVVNAALLMNQFDIAGLLGANPMPHVFDGSLWTLVFEGLCYAFLAGVGVCGVLRRQRWIVLAVVLGLYGLTVLQTLGVDVVIGDLLVRLALMFFLGSAAWLFADRLPMTAALAGAAAALLVFSVVLANPYRLVGAAAFAYLIMWLGTSIPWKVHVRTDLSYGMYIYHYLVLQVLMLTWASRLSTPLFVVLGVLTTLLPSAVSWFLVERPALRHKNGPLIETVVRILQRRPGVPAAR